MLKMMAIITNNTIPEEGERTMFLRAIVLQYTAKQLKVRKQVEYSKGLEGHPCT